MQFLSSKLYTICLLSRLTESAHIKTNLLHNLKRAQNIGLTPVDEFQSSLPSELYQKCIAKSRQKIDKRTWYNLTLDAFVEHIEQVLTSSLLSILYCSFFVLKLDHYQLYFYSLTCRYFFIFDAHADLESVAKTFVANYFSKTPTNLQTKEHFDSAYEKEIDATRTIVRSWSLSGLLLQIQKILMVSWKRLP